MGDRFPVQPLFTAEEKETTIRFLCIHVRARHLHRHQEFLDPVQPNNCFQKESEKTLKRSGLYSLIGVFSQEEEINGTTNALSFQIELLQVKQNRN